MPYDFPGADLYAPHDPRQHAYVRKLLRLQRRGRIPKEATLVHMRVEHDRWCPSMKEPAGVCTCTPTLRWTNPDTGQEHAF